MHRRSFPNGSIAATVAAGASPPSTTNSGHAIGTAGVPVRVLRAGDGVFVGVQPELSTDTALAIRKHSPCPHTAVMPMPEGGAKNLADARSHARITYEAMGSSYAQGTAETVAAGIADLLRSLRG
ncbi:hypothetical protein [Streptomyces sp. NPDC058683]|uniref:hypothetical protein n=1 Tax=Streptomyces sp. NPDC058683 TaxID=3346597 RepID=UPI00364DD15D